MAFRTLRSISLRLRAPAALCAACIAIACTGAASAAAPRDAWVVGRVYAANHPYAATAADDLATKMAKMRQGPFVF